MDNQIFLHHEINFQINVSISSFAFYSVAISFPDKKCTSANKRHSKLKVAIELHENMLLVPSGTDCMMISVLILINV